MRCKKFTHATKLAALAGVTAAWVYASLPAIALVGVWIVIDACFDLASEHVCRRIRAMRRRRERDMKRARAKQPQIVE